MTSCPARESTNLEFTAIRAHTTSGRTPHYTPANTILLYCAGAVHRSRVLISPGTTSASGTAR